MENRNDYCTCDFKEKWLLINNKNRATFHWCMIIFVLQIKIIVSVWGTKKLSCYSSGGKKSKSMCLHSCTLQGRGCVCFPWPEVFAGDAEQFFEWGCIALVFVAPRLPWVSFVFPHALIVSYLMSVFKCPSWKAWLIGLRIALTQYDMILIRSAEIPFPSKDT